MANNKKTGAIIIKANEDNSVKEIVIEQVDKNKYQNIKASDKLNWFYGICSVTLMLIGIFVGIILCCLCILFA